MENTDKKYKIGILEDKTTEDLLPFSIDILNAKDKNILVLGGSETFSSHRQKRYCEIVEEQVFPDLYLNTEVLKTETEGYTNPALWLFYNDEVKAKYTKEQYKQMEFAYLRDKYYRNRCNIIGIRYCSDQDAEYYAGELLKDIFLPQIAEKKTKSWQRLETETAARNLRKWMIFGHCFGDRIARYMDFLMYHQMVKIGYNTEEISYIQRQMTVFGHNSMVESIGQDSKGFLYFERMLGKDGEYQSQKFPQDSFQSYFQRMKISPNKVYLSPLNERELALLVLTTNDRRNMSSIVIFEHDKGYWKNTEYKTSSAQKEERIFRAFFNEILRTDYFLQNWQQIINNTMSNFANEKNGISLALKNGQKYYKYHNNNFLNRLY